MNAPTNTWKTPPAVAAQIAGLSDLAMPAIKSLWLRLFDAEPPTHNRQFLERRIAYRLQEVEFRKVNPHRLHPQQPPHRVAGGHRQGQEARSRLPPCGGHPPHPGVPWRGLPRGSHGRRPVRIRGPDVPEPVDDRPRSPAPGGRAPCSSGSSRSRRRSRRRRREASDD